jgi:hypothetical protein
MCIPGGLVKDQLNVQINDAQRKCNLLIQSGAEGDGMSLELKRTQWAYYNVFLHVIRTRISMFDICFRYILFVLRT